MTIDEQKQIFDEWIAQHKGLIFKVVRVYGWTEMDRDDLFQEISLQVWRSIPSFRKESAVTTWIYRIALNVSIGWLRKEKKLARPEPLDDAHHVIHETREADDERLAWLYEEIHKLDEIDRSITLLMLDGLSYKEMASIIGITESHIGVKINRIKKVLINRSKKSDEYGI